MECWKPNTGDINHKKQANIKGTSKLSCKKHSKHRQTSGVCALCLAERLVKLSNSSSCRCGITPLSSTSTSSCSYLSSLSSSDASSCSSPVVSYTHLMHLEGRQSMKLFNNVGQKVVRKSRSMAFVMERSRKEGTEDANYGKYMGAKLQIWQKLVVAREIYAALAFSSPREIQYSF